MRILNNTLTPIYHEIEIEYSFLWIKYKVKYRKINNSIFKYKSTDNYYEISVSEYFMVKDMFYAFPTYF